MYILRWGTFDGKTKSGQDRREERGRRRCVSVREATRLFGERVVDPKNEWAAIYIDKRTLKIGGTDE